MAKFISTQKNAEVIYLQETGHRVYFQKGAWLHSETCKQCAAQSKQTATMAFLHQMPSGAEEFETADTLNVTWADWVPDGFAAVYRGGTEQPEEGKNGQ